MRLTRDIDARALDRAGDCRPRSAFRRFFLAGVAALALAGSGCTQAFYSRPPERVTQLGNAFDTLSAEQLGFVRGQTSLEDAMGIMRSQGMTHVVENTNVAMGGATISVLSADFQYLLHIFRNRTYEQSIRLGFRNAELPQRYLLRVADYGGQKAIVALARDAAGFEPPMLIIVPYANGTVGSVSSVSLSELEQRHNGMQSPIFVGYDLRGDGITFIARDRTGTPWENGYIISWDGSTLRKRPVPFSELIMCDCIRDWAQGEGTD
ncbi:MAG: hypothetical protein V1861_02485 [Candidatus Micrarchaeota archaeon]